MYPSGSKMKILWSPFYDNFLLKIFYDTQFWAPTFKILAKTMGTTLSFGGCY